MQRSLISSTQKIVIYETKARYFVVGSNNTETRFRILKIDRMEPRDLVITDDKIEYSRPEIRDVLQRIDLGNRGKVTQKGSIGLKRTVSAFGIVGFVRFLEGYYMVLITKRRRVALIGGHTVYKVEDTTMIYIPNDLVRVTHSDEQRYVKMFQNVDLSSNFYFSYSYDLTHSLQYNLAAAHLPAHSTLSADLTSTLDAADAADKHSVWRSEGQQSDLDIHPGTGCDTDIEDASNAVQNLLEKAETSSVRLSSTSTSRPGLGPASKAEQSVSSDSKKEVVYGIKTAPFRKYMWNEFLLQKVFDELHSDWILYLVHGFIGQSNMSVFGHSVYLTLIARRSNRHAGTRFLKRGATTEGSVANEVETEQIVHSATTTLFDRTRLTSFVQLRGSIPLHWSQDVSKMPKPPISLDQSDPYGHVAGQHFNEVLRRYGAPVIVLDLVKRRERKKQESLISEEFVQVLRYLNQFLPPQHNIKYIGFDMARLSKAKNSNVLHRLAEIAHFCVRQTGFFQNRAGFYCREIRPNYKLADLLASSTSSERRQCGVVRTNCVDCLDRTNTAQFAIGKCALAFQLHALGIIDEPKLDFDSDCIRMLEDLYEGQGDTLALQYGGSQLVHRIKGYRKIAPWTSSSRDIMQTLSRYYSNAFSDSEKQNAINLFLGVFDPQEGQTNLWDLSTDFYLHNTVFKHSPRTRTRRYTEWWEHAVVRTLPYSYDDETKGQDGTLLHIIRTDADDERVNVFWEHYRPYELTTLDERYSFNMPNSIRDFMPKSASNCSPIAARAWPGGRRQNGDGTTETNPSVSGKDSTSSTQSTGSESSTSDSEGSDIDCEYDLNEGGTPRTIDKSSTYVVSLKDLFPTMWQVYGVEIKNPNKSSSAVYKRFSVIGQNACPISNKDAREPEPSSKSLTVLTQTSMFPLDSCYRVEPPSVPPRSIEIYQQYVRRGLRGAGPPTKSDFDIYKRYVAKASASSAGAAAK